jgi:NitT/TauT family transport system permease protein
MSVLLRHALPLLAFIACWEVFVRVSGIPAYILPSPWQIAGRFDESFAVIMSHAAYSTFAILVGFGAAVTTGFVLAVLIAYSRWMERVAEPFIVVSQVVPKVALAPLFLIWFGHGIAPKIIIVATIAFFPILVNTIVGLKSAEREVVELMDSVAATKTQVFWKIRLPTALPFMFPAIKVAALLSVVGAMVGEFVGSDRGLGYLMIVSNTNLETDMLFAALFAITLIGLAIYGAIGFLEHRVLTRFGDGASMQLMPL